MNFTKLTRRLPFIIATVLLLGSSVAFPQSTIPFTLTNNSTYTDANIYVAVVGIINDNHVWIDTKTSTVNTMSTSDNTVQGPVLNGDQGPGGNGMYANCFAKLSEIPNKVIQIPAIAGCRILIAFEEQLYLYFFGASGGYSAPNLSNPNDPNQGIRFEMIELTNASNGLWANTTRVDAYQYPMGLEVWGSDSFYKKVGERITHDEVITQWTSSVPSEFSSCLDASLEIIHFPSKTTAFQEGGAQADYFGSYIDAIWSKYSSGALVFDAGDAGTWSGTVSGEVFTFTRTSDGQVGTIAARPTTIEAMEGSGVLASGAQWDLVVQAQICAAINRHAINLNLATGAKQDFSTTSGFYNTTPYNWYCKFWHDTDISVDGLTYAFCYDDVFDKSSTINASSPLNATITIGGFSGLDDGDDDDDGDSGETTKIEAESYTYMSGIETETTTDDGGGLNVGYIDAGDWMSYDVTITTAGAYVITYRVASPSDGTTLRLEKDAGTTQLGTVTIPNTGGWQVWANVSHTVTLPAGTYSVGIATATGNFNLNYFTITSTSSSSATARTAATASEAYITESEETNTVALSPNPVRDVLYIHHAETIQTLTIYTLQGQKMLTKQNPASTLSVQQLNAGLHIVVLQYLNGAIQKEKIIIE